MQRDGLCNTKNESLVLDPPGREGDNLGQEDLFNSPGLLPPPFCSTGQFIFPQTPQYLDPCGFTISLEIE